MTRKEAMRRVRESGGNLCVRYIADPATRKPMFAEQLLQITRRAPSLAAGVMTASMALSTPAFAQGGVAIPEKTVIEQGVETAAKDKKPESCTDEPVSGSVTGTVTDTAGAVIPNIAIELTNISTNETRSAFTNEDGVYKFTDLVEGKYTILFKGNFGFLDRTIDTVAVGKGENTTNVSLDVMEMTGVIVVAEANEPSLIAAVKNGEIQLVKDLVSRGEHVDGNEADSMMPLFAAVEGNNIEMIQLLLDLGADVNARDESKKTPLMRANGDTTSETIKLFLNYGARIDLTDDDGNTALIIAADECNEHALQALIDGGADLDVQNKKGETALMKACDLASTRVLLEAGAKVNLQDKDGDTALDWTSNEELRQLLISYGATGKVKAKADDNAFVIDEPQSEPEN